MNMKIQPMMPIGDASAHAYSRFAAAKSVARLMEPHAAFGDKAKAYRKTLDEAQQAAQSVRARGMGVLHNQDAASEANFLAALREHHQALQGLVSHRPSFGSLRTGLFNDTPSLDGVRFDTIDPRAIGMARGEFPGTISIKVTLSEKQDFWDLADTLSFYYGIHITPDVHHMHDFGTYYGDVSLDPNVGTVVRLFKNVTTDNKGLYTNSRQELTALSFSHLGENGETQVEIVIPQGNPLRYLQFLANKADGHFSYGLVRFTPPPELQSEQPALDVEKTPRFGTFFNMVGCGAHFFGGLLYKLLNRHVAPESSVLGAASFFIDAPDESEIDYDRVTRGAAGGSSLVTFNDLSENPGDAQFIRLSRQVLLSGDLDELRGLPVKEYKAVRVVDDDGIKRLIQISTGASALYIKSDSNTQAGRLSLDGYKSFLESFLGVGLSAVESDEPDSSQSLFTARILNCALRIEIHKSLDSAWVTIDSTVPFYNKNVAALRERIKEVVVRNASLQAVNMREEEYSLPYHITKGHLSVAKFERTGYQPGLAQQVILTEPLGYYDIELNYYGVPVVVKIEAGIKPSDWRVLIDVPQETMGRATSNALNKFIATYFGVTFNRTNALINDIRDMSRIGDVHDFENNTMNLSAVKKYKEGVTEIRLGVRKPRDPHGYYGTSNKFDDADIPLLSDMIAQFILRLRTLQQEGPVEFFP